jgi:hypothetical protein
VPVQEKILGVLILEKKENVVMDLTPSETLRVHKILIGYVNQEPHRHQHHRNLNNVQHPAKMEELVILPLENVFVLETGAGMTVVNH